MCIRDSIIAAAHRASTFVAVLFIIISSLDLLQKNLPIRMDAPIVLYHGIQSNERIFSVLQKYFVLILKVADEKTHKAISLAH